MKLYNFGKGYKIPKIYFLILMITYVIFLGSVIIKVGPDLNLLNVCHLSVAHGILCMYWSIS